MNEITINTLKHLIKCQGEEDTLLAILELKKLSKQKLKSVIHAISRGDVSEAKALAQITPTVEATPASRVLWMLLKKAKLSKTEAKTRLHSELTNLMGNAAPAPGRVGLEKWVEQLMGTRHASTVMRAAMAISD